MAHIDPNREKDPEVVSSHELLMEFPTISVEDWRRAATGYLKEAGQLAFILDQRQSSAEALLDQADDELASGNIDDAKSHLWNAWNSQIDPSTPLGLHSGVRAGFISRELPGEQPDSLIVPTISLHLRNVGLNDVANVIERYGQVTAGLDDDAIHLLRLGALTRVEQWAVASVEFEDMESV